MHRSTTLHMHALRIPGAVKRSLLPSLAVFAIAATLLGPSVALAAPCTGAVYDYVIDDTVGTAVASVTLDGIPSASTNPNCDFTSIHAEFTGTSTATTGCDPAIKMELGHSGTLDSGANYNNMGSYNFGSGWSNVNSYHAADPQIGQVPCSTRGADTATSCKVEIPEAFDASFYHMVQYQCSMGYNSNSTGTGVSHMFGAYQHLDVSTVTDIKFICSGCNFAVGSYFIVWES